jgi:hypothetical protein
MSLFWRRQLVRQIIFRRITFGERMIADALLVLLAAMVLVILIAGVAAA